MIKTILVPVVGTSPDVPAFATAVNLARSFTGHLDFLYARPDPVTAGAVYGAVFMPGMLEELRRSADRQHNETRNAYLDACRREEIPTDIVGAAVGKMTARWHQKTGKVLNCVAEEGRASDLVIVERGHDILAIEALQGALFQTGRPVLIPGERPPSFDTIAIAWKPTREAARAVAAVLPLLPLAKRVVIITASEDGAVDAGHTERLATNLMRHHPAVETIFLDAGPLDVTESLLLHTYRVGAGLLVMGAYTRPPLRELIFGGVTENMLDRCEVPLFMAH